MFPVFDVVEKKGSLGSRVAQIHSYLKTQPMGAAISRLSLALHDNATGIVSTLAFSNNAGIEVANIVIPLQEVPSLKLLTEARSYRRIDDVVSAYDGARDHSADIMKNGIRSSLTFPVRHKGWLVGFLFVNSGEPGYFTPERADFLSPYVAILSMMLVDEVGRSKAAGRAAAG